MIKTFYLNRIVYYVAAASAIVYLLSYFYPSFFQIGNLILVLLGIAVLVDIFLIYSKKKGISAERITIDRFSIGDPNKVILEVNNQYPFVVKVSVIDELPIQFQERNWLRKARIERNGKWRSEYFLKPATRGEYFFGNINIYVHAPLQLVK